MSNFHGHQHVLFDKNPFEGIMKSIQYDGDLVKVVGRLVQTFPGTMIKFFDGGNRMVDSFIMTMEDLEMVKLSIKCEDKIKILQVKNNTAVNVPLRCSALAGGKIWIRQLTMKIGEMRDLGAEEVEEETNTGFGSILRQNHITEQNNCSSQQGERDIPHKPCEIVIIYQN